MSVISYYEPTPNRVRALTRLVALLHVVVAFRDADQRLDDRVGRVLQFVRLPD